MPDFEVIAQYGDEENGFEKSLERFSSEERALFTPADKTRGKKLFDEAKERFDGVLAAGQIMESAYRGTPVNAAGEIERFASKKLAKEYVERAVKFSSTFSQNKDLEAMAYIDVTYKEPAPFVEHHSTFYETWKRVFERRAENGGVYEHFSDARDYRVIKTARAKFGKGTAPITESPSAS